MAFEAVQLSDAGEVEQVIHGERKIHLHKERWLIDERISLVRKYAAIGGPPVVLVHGFAQNRYSWHASRRSFSAYLASLGYDVYNLELRGHGNSRAGLRPERFDDYLEDVARVAGLIGEPAFWIGHSLGGAVVYAAATRVPMRGVVGIGALFRFAQANRALNLLCKLSNLLGERASVGGISIRTRLAGRLMSRLYSVSDIAGYAFPISGWAPGSMEPDLLAERLERGFDWTSIQVWLDMARWGSSGAFDHEEAWRRTQVPVFVIAGDYDHLMLPEDARVAYDLAGGEDRLFQVFDLHDTGFHWGHLDLILGHQAPRFVWAAISDWLRER